MYLHEAIEKVVRDAGGSCPIAAVVEEIARRDLYRRRDGRHPHRNQVDARISKYPERFYRPSRGVVALR